MTAPLPRQATPSWRVTSSVELLTPETINVEAIKAIYEQAYMDVSMKGGITKKSIVPATRIFLMLVPKAVNECDEDSIIE